MLTPGRFISPFPILPNISDSFPIIIYHETNAFPQVSRGYRQHVAPIHNGSNTKVLPADNWGNYFHLPQWLWVYRFLVQCRTPFQLWWVLFLWNTGATPILHLIHSLSAILEHDLHLMVLPRMLHLLWIHLGSNGIWPLVLLYSILTVSTSVQIIHP